ncbi:DUF1045 domain-containing protein [Arsenicitalea aurantiaca]|uniref:DUF1045 domain-containing protein n=1 Tax=Arsenicitalea aurantiaca TaxID=1783274 RepID=A0A433X8E3_9HYPH|nr:DUF1045 domain-containing protein [Arsenicitalea aurantiaca]RUT30322.1 DUF1045 domain-containing protein [Arsenicitalea aurantiaca]
MTERFAIYYAPGQTTALWQRASQWLGRDAATGAMLQPPVPGLMRGRLNMLVAQPARYGFHATLKAPMRLAPGTTREALEGALADFVMTRRGAAIGRLRLAIFDRTLVLMPELQSERLRQLAAQCVVAFEPFRAPLRAEDRARRAASGLSERQLMLLERFGYPYVMEAFRFHMTLTGRLAPEEAGPVQAAAQAFFAPVLEAPLTLDRLSLFHEPAPGQPLRRLVDFPFSIPVDV